MERLARGKAKVEFYAVAEEVKNLMEKGYSIKLSYDKMIEEKKITMSYRAFYDNLKKYNKKQTTPKKKPRIRETTPSKMIFENDPAKQSRHF